MRDSYFEQYKPSMLHKSIKNKCVWCGKRVVKANALEYLHSGTRKAYCKGEATDATPLYLLFEVLKSHSDALHEFERRKLNMVFIQKEVKKLMHILNQNL